MPTHFNMPFPPIIAVLAAADKCLLALRRVKTEGMQRKRKAKEEVSSLFKKKCVQAGGKSVWKHRFVCLAYCDQYKIPTTDIRKIIYYKLVLVRRTSNLNHLTWVLTNLDKCYAQLMHNWRTLVVFSSSNVSRTVDDWSHYLV